MAETELAPGLLNFNDLIGALQVCLHQVDLNLRITFSEYAPSRLHWKAFFLPGHQPATESNSYHSERGFKRTHLSNV